MTGMRRTTGAIWLTLLAGSAMAQQPQPRTQPAPQAQPRPQASTPQTAGPLPATRAVLDRFVADGRAPGLVGAFGFGDRPTIFISTGRISDDPGAQAAGPDSLWRVYSMTKPITGMAAMLLVQDGKIALDDPVSRYIPAFAKMRVLTSPDTSLDSVPAKNQITIRELLTHTAGLSYSIVAKGPLLKEYERLGILPATLNASVEAQARKVRPRTLAEFADRVATLPLIAEPGTKWSYSIGLDVMGAVIEKASGMPFDRFVQTRLLDPLKMTSTFWQVPRGDLPRFATNYAAVAGARVPLDPAATSPWMEAPEFPYGGAGLVSSARDYDRFLHMLQDGGTLDGVQVMTPETARAATSDLLPPTAKFTGYTPGTLAGAGFGAGGMVIVADVPGGAHKGTYGWDGAANTVSWVNPLLKVRGTVMVNMFPAGSLPITREVTAALVKDVEGMRR
jgi:CubicO group peptidase (beta-lactamase class C family)